MASSSAAGSGLVSVCGSVTRNIKDFIAVNAAAEAQANAAAEAVADAHDHAEAQADAEAASDALDLDRPPRVSLSPTSKYEQRKGTKMSVRCNAS